MQPGLVTMTELVAIMIGCVLVQAFFVSAEVALSACDRNALRARAAGGSSNAARAEKMLAVPQVTLATTLVGANLATLVAVLVLALDLMLRDISPMWAPLFVVPPLLVLGHLVPKSIVQAHADGTVDRLATPLRLASYALRPLVVVVGGFAAALTRVTRTDRKKAFVTRDELALLIESEPTSDKPEIGADEREMIANVFELSEYKAAELMVPLSEITALHEDAPIAEAALEVADKQHSRMPIYRARVDDIVGIVHVFDILAAASPKSTEGKPGEAKPAETKPAPKTVADLAHSPTYVPGTMRASDLLVQLQTEQQHLAIVVDEYGGAVGIITIEDLLEIIVGDIDDEYDVEPSPIKAEKPGVWRVEARTNVARLNAELELGLPESDDYETIAGLLIEKFRRIPDKGESLAIGSVLIEILAATDRAIEAVRITRRKK
ncbi:MAG TPA: hemolysin family protein [Kofleriaceae bacterium]|nr:hemolysin family protein [Kofleriaceae bacterium]